MRTALTLACLLLLAALLVGCSGDRPSEAPVVVQVAPALSPVLVPTAPATPSPRRLRP